MLHCELCDRASVPVREYRQMERLTVHHLVPRQTTKRKKIPISDTIDICSSCHRQIHALFDNKYLATHLNTVEKLRSEPKMQKFLAWISKQQNRKRIKVSRQR